MSPKDGRALEKFEQQTAVPMLVLALAIIPLLIVPLAFDLSARPRKAILAIEWFIWAAFVLEYGIRLYLAPHKGRFVRGNLIDLAVIALPFLRPLRVFRSARALRVLRAARGGIYLVRGLDAARDVLTKHKLNYVLLITLVAVVGGALLVESFEATVEDANISSFPDAVWWAVTTVTTVGYGDRFPVTAGGRAVGVVLMVLGITLFGLLTASLASHFVESREEEVDPKLEEVTQRLERIESLLREQNRMG